MKSIKAIGTAALAAAGLLFMMQPVYGLEAGAKAGVNVGADTDAGKTGGSSAATASTDTTTTKKHHRHHRHGKPTSEGAGSSSTGAGASAGAGVKAGGAGVDAGAGASTGSPK